MLTTLAVENHPSLRGLVTRLGALTIASAGTARADPSLYRALPMFADAARVVAVWPRVRSATSRWPFFHRCPAVRAEVVLESLATERA